MSARRTLAGLLAILVLAGAGAGCGGSASSQAHTTAQPTGSGHPLHWPPAARTTKLRPGQPCLPSRDAFYHRSALKCVNGRLRLLST